MNPITLEIPLACSAPGTRRTIRVRRYGQAGARPKAYVQGGLHADEVPGMLVAHHLCRRLDAAAAAGHVRGEVLVVPVANPIGLDQVVDERLLGRFDLAGGGNFNRNYVDLVPALVETLRGRLTDDPFDNVARVRRTIVTMLEGLRPVCAADALRWTLLGLAVDADFVLDLHCDDEALPHLYLGSPLWPDAADLAGYLNSRLVLLAEVSGGEPFDEACSALWWRLAASLSGEGPLPAACLATTIELRGMTDVDDVLAAEDADGIMAFLQHRGVVAGKPPLPAAGAVSRPLAGVDMVMAPSAGIVCHRAAVGDHVRMGDVVAELVDPTADDATAMRRSLTASTDGLVFARTHLRFARAGGIVCKIAGADPLPGKGTKLLTNR